VPPYGYGPAPHCFSPRVGRSLAFPSDSCGRGGIFFWPRRFCNRHSPNPQRGAGSFFPPLPGKPQLVRHPHSPVFLLLLMVFVHLFSLPPLSCLSLPPSALWSSCSVRAPPCPPLVFKAHALGLPTSKTMVRSLLVRCSDHCFPRCGHKVS